MTDQNVEQIAKLNDLCRQGKGGEFHTTPGIRALGGEAVPVILERIKNFDDFNPDNNPHGERDFGSFTYNDENIFWKIDYYNLDKSAGSENPADPGQTTRVLMIMLASEY